MNECVGKTVWLVQWFGVQEGRLLCQHAEKAFVEVDGTAQVADLRDVHADERTAILAALDVQRGAMRKTMDRIDELSERARRLTEPKTEAE